MPDRYFLDTNVFVYCFDSGALDKQRHAQALVQKALTDHQGIISYQVVQEFLNVATRKFRTPMSSREASAYLETVLSPLCEVFASIDLYREALSIQVESGFSFFDSLVVASAVLANCARLYSEDLQSGRSIRGVHIQNPFAAPSPVRK